MTRHHFLPPHTKPEAKNLQGTGTAKVPPTRPAVQSLSSGAQLGKNDAEFESRRKNCAFQIALKNWAIFLAFNLATISI